jgi:hypothetical protein
MKVPSFKHTPGMIAASVSSPTGAATAFDSAGNPFEHRVARAISACTRCRSRKSKVRGGTWRRSPCSLADTLYESASAMASCQHVYVSVDIVIAGFILTYPFADPPERLRKGLLILRYPESLLTPLDEPTGQSGMRRVRCNLEKERFQKASRS